MTKPDDIANPKLSLFEEVAREMMHTVALRKPGLDPEIVAIEAFDLAAAYMNELHDRRDEDPDSTDQGIEQALDPEICP